MRYFPILDFQYVVIGLFLGLMTVAVLFMAFYTYNRRGAAQGDKKDLEEYAEGIRGDHNPIPPVVALVLLGVASFALIYAFVVGIRGPAF